MIKWLFEVLVALRIKHQLGSTFWQALRFVRCDYLCQQEIKRILGCEDPKKGD